MGKIIGIDLGTTTSEVAFLKDGVPTIVKNIGEDNSSVIPSVVLIEKNDIKVGIKAKNKQILSPKNVISEVKRLIGTDEKITIEGKEYKPEQITAMILKKIKSVAEFYIGEEVEEAVITVPANFNERERRATKDAGKIAGIKVERIINEPTAAALAYGINNLENNSNILVYDLGGGTFDVTILEYFEGILDVKVSRGNNRLGGKDIDSILLDLVLKKFKEKNSFNINLEDKRVKTALLTAIKEGKENLSFDEEVEIIVPYVAVDENYNPIDLEVTIKRREFEDNLKFIIDKSFEVIDETLRVADLDKNEIDKIILVGGSTRIPFLRKTIEQYFGEKIVSGINPEEIVALGAAVQGGLKKGLLDKATIILTDSCSHSLGLEVLGGKFDPIIKRDDKLPISVKKVYKTVEDNQEVVEINIYEGEEKAVENNNFIGSFEILDIPRAKRGKEKIEVVFDYDLNGILDVQATIVSTEKVATKKITLKGLSSKEIEVMEEQLREIESFKVNEIILKEKVEKLENNKEIEEKVIVINEVVEEDKKEEELVVEETSKSDSEEEEEEEEYTAEHLYMDVKKITNYYNYRVEHLEPTVKKEAGDLLQDLVGAVKKADAKGGLALINKILELIQE